MAQEDEDEDGDAQVDALKAEIEKKQKVQEAVYAYVEPSRTNSLMPFAAVPFSTSMAFRSRSCKRNAQLCALLFTCWMPEMSRHSLALTFAPAPPTSIWQHQGAEEAAHAVCTGAEEQRKGQGPRAQKPRPPWAVQQEGRERRARWAWGLAQGEGRGGEARQARGQAWQGLAGPEIVLSEIGRRAERGACSVLHYWSVAITFASYAVTSLPIAC